MTFPNDPAKRRSEENPAANIDYDSIRPVALSDRPPCPPAMPAHRYARPGRIPASRFLSLAASIVALVAAVGAASPSSNGSAQDAPHSASPALKSAENGSAVRWHQAQVTLSLDPSLDSLGTGAKQAVKNAVGAWIEADPGLPSLSFDHGDGTRGVAARDGVNRVLAGPIDLPGHENDLAITTAYSDAETGAIVEVDMVFNTAHSFADLGNAAQQAGDEADGDGEGPGHERNAHCHQEYDIQNVATHEFGHFFGLGEDKAEDQATMFYKSRACETIKRDLFPTDTSAVDQLYQAGFQEEQPAGCAITSPKSGGFGEGAGLATAVAALALVALRRSRG